MNNYFVRVNNILPNHPKIQATNNYLVGVNDKEHFVNVELTFTTY